MLLVLGLVALRIISSAIDVGTDSTNPQHACANWIKNFASICNTFDKISLSAGEEDKCVSSPDNSGVLQVRWFEFVALGRDHKSPKLDLPLAKDKLFS